jgi:hypothetical protein
MREGMGAGEAARRLRMEERLRAIGYVADDANPDGDS